MKLKEITLEEIGQKVLSKTSINIDEKIQECINYICEAENIIDATKDAFVRTLWNIRLTKIIDELRYYNEVDVRLYEDAREQHFPYRIAGFRANMN